MCAGSEPTFRELVANIVDWRARVIPPEDRSNYAAAVVAQVFGLEQQEEFDDGSGGRNFSANELLDHAAEWFERSRGAEGFVLTKLFLVMSEQESCRGNFYINFGFLCDRMVNEAQFPRRRLQQEDVRSLTKALQCELRRRQCPVAQ